MALDRLVLPTRTARIASLGLRIAAIGNVRQYLRNGYMSWDGSFFVEPATAREVAQADPKLAAGHAMTALLPHRGDGRGGARLPRHDRYPGARCSFESGDGSRIDIETLIDRVPHEGEMRGETLVLFSATRGGGEPARAGRDWWPSLAAAAAPTGAADQRLVLVVQSLRLAERADAAGASGPRRSVSATKQRRRSTFSSSTTASRPRWATGSTPGRNSPTASTRCSTRRARPASRRGCGSRRSWWAIAAKLYAAHPDWVVKSRATGKPLAPMTFYGEFRWHKRSEEYYVLDVTHPDAEAYIRKVFRTWAKRVGLRLLQDRLHAPRHRSTDPTKRMLARGRP